MPARQPAPVSQSRLAWLSSFALLAGLTVCGRIESDPVAELLGYLPRQQALHLYLDFRAMRATPALASLLSAGTKEGQAYRGYLETFGIDDESSLQAVALSLADEGVYAAVRGRFREQHMVRAMEARGGRCEAPLHDAPCAAPLSDAGRRLAIMLASDDLVILTAVPSTTAPQEQVRHFSYEHPRLAARIGQEQEAGAFIWVSIDPPRLERAMRHPPLGVTNLTLIAKALEMAETASVSVAGEGAEHLVVLLRAPTADAGAAEELGKLLGGLNALAASAVDLGRGDAEPSDWGRALRTARFETNGAGVKATWTIPAALLTQSPEPEG